MRRSKRFASTWFSPPPTSAESGEWAVNPVASVARILRLRIDRPRPRFRRTRFPDGRVDLGDIAARELHDGRIPLIGGIGSDQNRDSGRLGLGESIREVCDLIAGRLPPVGKRKMAIRHQHGQLAEVRLDPNSPIGVSRAPDLDAGRMRVIGDDFAMREGNETANELRPLCRRTNTRGFPEWSGAAGRTARSYASKAVYSRRRAIG